VRQLEDRLAPALLTVTSALDPAILTPGTLRSAVSQANTDAANGISDTIVFNTAQMGSGTVTLQHGELELWGGTGTTTINGGGLVTVSGNNASRVFLIAIGAQATLSGLTIAQGNANGGAGNEVPGQWSGMDYWGTLTAWDGGGIANQGTLTVSGTTFTGDTAGGGGGAIVNYGALTVSNSTLAGNSAATGGGGIQNWATLTVADSTLSGNSAGGYGGAGGGGGIVNFSGTVPYGWSNGQAGSIGFKSYNGTATLAETIVAGNVATGSQGVGPDVQGSLTAGSAYNLIGSANGLSGISNGSGGNIVGASALLALLGNYGGPTQTMALQSGSPAVAAGGAVTALSSAVTDPTATTLTVADAAAIASTAAAIVIAVDGEQMLVTSVNPAANTLTVVRGCNGTTAAVHSAAAGVYLATDQRGLARPGKPDIGAYQTQPAAALTIIAPGSATAGAAFTVTIAAVDQYGNVASNYTGSATLTSSDGQAVSPGAATLTNGTATVAVTLDRADTTTMTATDVGLIRVQPLTAGGSAAAATAVSGSIAVSPAAAVNLTVNAPARVTAGNSFPVTITALDAYKNIATGYSGSVTLASADGQSISPAAVTLTAGTATAEVTLADGGVTQLAAAAGAECLAGSSGTVLVVAPGMGAYYLDPTATSHNTAGSLYDTSTGQVVDTGVAMFRVDGAGALTVLDNQQPATIPLWNGGTYSTPSYTLKVFSGGQNAPPVTLSGVTMFVLDGAGSVVALQVPPAGTGPQPFRVPLYNLVRFTGSSFQVIDSSVSTIALDGAGAVVALDQPLTIPTTLQDGQTISRPVYRLDRFAPGGDTPQPMTSADGTVTTFSKLAVDASGAVFALGAPSFGAVNLPSGEQVTTSLAPLLRFAPAKNFAASNDPGQVVYNGVSTFLVDGAGSVVALADPTTSVVTLADGQACTKLVYSMIRFGPAPATPQTIDTGVSSLTLDGSGSVVALDSLTAGASGAVGTLHVFRPGSNTPACAMANVSSFAVDGSGSVVALADGALIRCTPGCTTGVVLVGPPTTGSEDGNVGPGNNGGTAPQPTYYVGNISQFLIDGAGGVVAMNVTSTGNHLIRFAPGSFTAVTMDSGASGNQVVDNGPSVTSFGVDGSGSVVALQAGQLVLYTPGQPAQPMASGVTSFAVDGSGSVVALVNGALVRFAAGKTVAQSMAFPPATQGYNDGEQGSIGQSYDGVITQWAIDAAGYVAALDQLPDGSGDLILFAPGSDTSQLMESPNGESVARCAVDGAGSVLALTSGNILVRFIPGTLNSFTTLGERVSNVFVDAAGSVVAVETQAGSSSETLVRFAPGSATPESMGMATACGEGAAGEIVALMGTELECFAPGSTNPTAVTNPDGTVAAVQSFLVDGAGGVWVLLQDNNLGFVNAGSTIMQVAYYGVADYPTSGSASAGTAVPELTVDKSGAVWVNGKGSVDGYEGLVRFQPGSMQVTANEPAAGTFFVDGSGYVTALVDGTATSGALIRFAPTGNSQVEQITNGTVDGNQAWVSGFFVETNGDVIAIDEDSSYAQQLVYVTPGSSVATPLAPDLVQFGVVTSGTMWALDSSGNLWEILVGQSGSYTRIPYATNAANFTLNQGQTWLASYQTRPATPPSHWWALPLEVAEQVGSMIASYYAGIYIPYIGVALADMATSIANQEINHWLLGTTFSWSKVGQAGLEGLVLGFVDDGLGNTGSGLGDGMGDGMGDAGGGLGDSVGDSNIATDFVNTDATAGQWLQTTLTSFAVPFVQGVIGGKPLGQAALGALEQSVADGLVGSTFLQDTVTYLDQAAADVVNNVADLPFTQDALSFVGQLVSGDLTDSVFGQEAMSFLVNAVTNAIEGQPLYAGALSFLEQAVVGGFADTPLGQDAASVLDQTAANGLGGTAFGTDVGDFVGQATTDLQQATADLAQGVSDAGSVSDFLQSAGSLLEQNGSTILGTPALSQALGGFLNQAATTMLGGTFGGQVGSFLEDVASGSSFGQAGLSLIEQLVSTNLTSTPFGAQIGQFVDTVASGGASNFDINALPLLSQLASSATLAGSPFAGQVGQFVNAVAGGAETAFDDGALPLLNQLASSAGLAGSPFAGQVGQFVDTVAGGVETTFDDNALTLLGQLASSSTTGVSQFTAQVGQFVDTVAGGVDTTFDQSALPVLSELASSASLTGTQLATDVGQFVDQVAGGVETTFDDSALTLVNQLASSATSAGSVFAAQAGQFVDTVAGGVETAFADNALAALNQLAAAAMTGTQFATDVGQFVNTVATGVETTFDDGALALVNQLASSATAAGSEFALQAGQFVDTVAGGVETAFDQAALPLLNQLAGPAAAAGTQFATQVGQFVNTVVGGVETTFDDNALPVLNQLAGSATSAGSELAVQVGQFVDTMAGGVETTFDDNALPVLNQLASAATAGTQFATQVGQFVNTVAGGVETTFDDNALPVLSQLTSSTSLATTQLATQVGQFVDAVSGGVETAFDDNALPVLNQLAGSAALAATQFAGQVGQFVDTVAVGVATTFDDNALPVLNQLASSGLATTQFAAQVGQFVDTVAGGVATAFDNSALAVLSQLASSAVLANTLFAQQVGQFVDQVGTGVATSFDTNALSLLNQLTSDAASQFAQEAGQFVDQVSAGVATAFDNDALRLLQHLAGSASLAGTPFAQEAGQFVDQVGTGAVTPFATKGLLLINQLAKSVSLAKTHFAQHAVSFLNHVASVGLARSAFAPMAVATLTQAIHAGPNAASVLAQLNQDLSAFTGGVRGQAVVFFLSAPVSGTAGTPVSVTLTVLDGYGNAATGYRGTVHFSSSDSLAVLPPDYHFTAAAKGRHTFMVTFRTQGSQSLMAVDTTIAGLKGSAVGIEVG
jgi:hypothetical protein